MMKNYRFLEKVTAFSFVDKGGEHALRLKFFIKLDKIG